uniref:Uncharacterized protein n=1 Tax=Leersia perrieri TaxID=77586 RepID=A0A0D9X5M4_9ORYZ
MKKTLGQVTRDKLQHYDGSFDPTIYVFKSLTMFLTFPFYFH